MTEAPEKVWATKSMAVQLNCQHKNVMGEWATEYTRSETAKARIEKLYQTWVHGDLTQTDFNEAFKD
jgi:hypothetical protein